MLNVERRTQLLEALRHSFPPDPELDSMLIADIDAIEPLIEAWIEEARTGVTAHD